MNMIEKCARAIAEGLGDDFDHAFANKSAWTAARGESGGRYRDINEPMQSDYLSAAIAVLRTLREPSPEMLRAGGTRPIDEGWPVTEPTAKFVWAAMIDAALSGDSEG